VNHCEVEVLYYIFVVLLSLIIPDKLTVVSLCSKMTNPFEAVFLKCARDLELVPLSATDTKINLLFPSLFGVSPVICGIIWEQLIEQGNLERGCKPIHLLWALFFLKCYACESILSQVLKSDRKTTRKWIWYLVSKIADLSNETVCFS
jgi:hypothetical protein